MMTEVGEIGKRWCTATRLYKKLKVEHDALKQSDFDEKKAYEEAVQVCRLPIIADCRLMPITADCRLLPITTDCDCRLLTAILPITADYY